MYSNILLPVAFENEEASEAPLAIAKALSAEGAKVTLLHVFERVPSYATQYVPQDLLKATRDGVMAELSKAAAKVPGGKGVIMDGSPGRAITDYAKEHGVDLIIMPSHEPSFGDVLWGSTAAFVVKHVDCAVHVIR